MALLLLVVIFYILIFKFSSTAALPQFHCNTSHNFTSARREFHCGFAAISLCRRHNQARVSRPLVIPSVSVGIQRSVMRLRHDLHVATMLLLAMTNGRIDFKSSSTHAQRGFHPNVVRISLSHSENFTVATSNDIVDCAFSGNFSAKHAIFLPFFGRVHRQNFCPRRRGNRFHP